MRSAHGPAGDAYHGGAAIRTVPDSSRYDAQSVCAISTQELRCRQSGRVDQAIRCERSRWAARPGCGGAGDARDATGALRRSAPPARPRHERDFLSRVRRLTVEGRRAGEGYWAPDGKRLVFQSEREPGNPFYQIYAVDLTTGDTVRISPGMGKTTCAFFRPGTDQILFASTHHDPKSKQYQDDELAFRASGKERRYAWDYDPEMEIYAVRREDARR